MTVNYTFTVFIILLIIGIIVGFKKGFIKGISNIVALIATLLALAVISMFTESFKGGDTRNSVMSVILLVILGTVYGVIKMLFRSMKKITIIPILELADHILGIVSGVVWVFLLANTIFVLAHGGHLWKASEYIMKDIVESKILTIITLYNPLM
jgi:hypothetical protein